ncbi:MAG: leucine--tRNA ligase [Proteobacteria bacterium]|nr:leucine--tRNA ligase [Pseudomonadota bacterium]
MTYNPHSVEEKWQNYWRTHQSFLTKTDLSKPKYFVLEMFPYPSGNIHMGHVRNYALGDVISRFKRAQQYNVLHPMGWDAFGLPAENAAIANKIHPSTWTFANIDSMRKQLLPLGFDYDWSREIATCTPEYYKHEQEMFIDFLNSGLAYQKESMVNWDPVDCTVLANEQVENGRGWRSGALVERRKMLQWFLKITSFADELLEELDNLKGWPENVLTMQRNWIGRSYGVNVEFVVAGTQDKLITYSTHPETIFGVSFIAIAPEHPFVAQCDNPELNAMLERYRHTATSEAQLEGKDKEGAFTGHFAIHPITGTQLPIYVANFVLMEYGSGAIFGCPGHDERDHEFATKYGLDITQVVQPSDADYKCNVREKPYTSDGTMINSGFLDGLSVVEAKEKIIDHFEHIGVGLRQKQYRLHDWGVSRQRYWGCPIPVIHCASCGPVSVPKEQLPVLLPEDVTFDKPGNPLEHHPTWKHVKCPSCSAKAVRDTDTFDTFFESSWYFIRFCAPHVNTPIDRKQAEYWLPVDRYIGGIEHAVMHLLYARFFTKALRECGYLDLSEPFTNLLTQGMICHETYRTKEGQWLYPEEVRKEGDKAYELASGHHVKIGRIEKMSKSKKNTINPDDMIRKYGADTVRLFALSDSPPERNMEWSASGVEGCHRYLSKIYAMAQAVSKTTVPLESMVNRETLEILHRTIEAITHDIDQYHYNKAIARIRELTNHLSQASSTDLRYAMPLVAQLLAPFTPHLAEEMWQMMGLAAPIALANWPVADPQYLVLSKVIIAVQINGKLRGTIETEPGTSQEQVHKLALDEAQVQKHLGGASIKKVIFVKDKIISFIV